MQQLQPKRTLRVGLISLGCAKNLVDAEVMLGSLLQSGIEITNDESDADAVIVNTCSFIDAAQEESIDAILESSQVREASNRGQALIVSGCLPQRFRDELPRLLPEVDAFMGIDQVNQVGGIVRQALARRTAKVAAVTRRPGTRKRIAAELAELDRNTAATKHSDLTLKESRSIGRVVAPLKAKSRVGFSAASDSPVQSRGAIVDVNLRPIYIPDYATPRFRLTPRHFAYLKIAEGCNHPCSFCIIPRMRGSHRSRTQADVVAEARRLLAEGVKELNLISQDSTYYGLDLRANHSRNIASPEKFRGATQALPADATTLCTLLRELNSLEGDFWIRLLYTHPAHWTDELIETIKACSKVARYVDIPLQHIHPNMLERMRRETSQSYIIDLLRRIRAGAPGVAIRTTFIVGFPGETDACFQTLLEFIRDARFERLGVFTYSKEAGTRAAGMAGQIPDRLKRRRRDLAMAEQHRVAREISQAFVGRTIKVLVERTSGSLDLPRADVVSWEHGLIRASESGAAEFAPRNCFVARGEADAPDIDGRVYVRGGLPVGEFAQVKVVGHTVYDLIAEPA
jgi:ribosomal protein S12 methylthiotransferase